MNKREFLKAGLLAGAATGLSLTTKADITPATPKKHKPKNWVWIGPNPKDTVDDLNVRYAG
jgi:hypothetical protein